MECSGPLKIFRSWKANAPACLLQPGKVWIFRDFSTSYHRGLRRGLAAGQMGHGAAAVAPVRGSVVAAAVELPSWAGITAAWRRWDVPNPERHVRAVVLLMTPLNLSSAALAAWCRGCSQEVNWILFFFLWINVVDSLPEWGQSSLVLNLCKQSHYVAKTDEGEKKQTSRWEWWSDNKLKNEHLVS